MSEGDDKPRGPGANKRRRRRRRPGGQGGTQSGAEQPTNAAKSGGGDKSGGAGRSRRRRGGRARGEQASSGTPDRGGDDKHVSNTKSKRGGRKRGANSDGRRGRTRRKSSEQQPPADSLSATGGREPKKPVQKSAVRTQSKPLYDQEASAPTEASRIRWGDDSEAPTPDIKLKPNLPADPSMGDSDPETAYLLASEGGYDGQLSARICNVIGVRFVPTGRLYLYDAGDGHYNKGDKVVVDGDRGQRTATVSVSSCRRPPPRSLKRIVRRGSLNEDANSDAAESEQLQTHLGIAKAKAKELRLPIKVFRVSFEEGRKKLAIYYSCEDKTDVRSLSRALADALPLRSELRHTGVRDEAKLVGGIGACGQELCCTTWLPSFAPVSIKHAKDQGLALTPSKISGQCGRLKCCLVYEQENYARMRKGLPKLGKRVITNDGFEGRVVEIDVLHQRIRVSVGRGESKVYKKDEIEPMFASQQQGPGKKKSARHQDRKSQAQSGDQNELESEEELPNDKQ